MVYGTVNEKQLDPAMNYEESGQRRKRRRLEVEDEDKQEGEPEEEPDEDGVSPRVHFYHPPLQWTGFAQTLKSP